MEPFSDRAKDAIEECKRATGAASNAEVIRRALVVYLSILRRIDDKGEVVIIGSGDPIRLIP